MINDKIVRQLILKVSHRPLTKTFQGGQPIWSNYNNSECCLLKECSSSSPAYQPWKGDSNQPQKKESNALQDVTNTPVSARKKRRLQAKTIKHCPWISILDYHLNLGLLMIEDIMAINEVESSNVDIFLDLPLDSSKVRPAL
jgi:hypothetical protein